MCGNTTSICGATSKTAPLKGALLGSTISSLSSIRCRSFTGSWTVLAIFFFRLSIVSLLGSKSKKKDRPSGVFTSKLSGSGGSSNVGGFETLGSGLYLAFWVVDFLFGDFVFSFRGFLLSFGEGGSGSSSRCKILLCFILKCNIGLPSSSSFVSLKYNCCSLTGVPSRFSTIFFTFSTNSSGSTLNVYFFPFRFRTYIIISPKTIVFPFLIPDPTTVFSSFRGTSLKDNRCSSIGIPCSLYIFFLIREILLPGMTSFIGNRTPLGFLTKISYGPLLPSSSSFFFFLPRTTSSLNPNIFHFPAIE